MTLARRLTGLERAVGGGGFSPDDIANLVGWYDFGEPTTLFTDSGRSSPVASDGDSINGVTDLSSAGNHLQNTGTGVLYKVNILNGHSAALYSGSGGLYHNGAVNYAQPNTIVIVGKHGDGASGKHIFDGSNTGRQLVGTTSGPVWTIYAGSLLTGGATDTNNNVFAAIFNSASSKLYVNGGFANASGAAGAQALGAGAGTAPMVGVDEGSVNGLPSGSYLYALYVYNASVSAEDLDSLGAYITDRWGLTWTSVVPGSISGLTHWYDFSDVATLWTDTGRSAAVTSDGDTIKGVTNKASGATIHLSEATNGPTYKTAIQNGKSVARFDGSNDTLATTANMGADASRTWFLVLKKRSAPGTALAALYYTIDAQVFTESPAWSATGYNFFANNATGVHSPLTSATAEDWNILVLRVNSTASLDAYGNGGTADNFVPFDSSPNGIAQDATLHIGSTSTPDKFMDVDYAEIVVYDSALSASDLNAVGEYLGDKWSITWTTVT